MTKRKGTALMVIGLVLMAAALLLTVYNMQTELQAGSAAAAVVGQLTQRLETPAPTEATQAPQETPLATLAPDYVRFPEMEMPTTEVDGESYIGTLTIPELGLTLPVISEWSYPRLKKSPCRFSGSAYTGDLIVIAHNYASHFGNLKTLQPGAQVSLTDMAGNVFIYAVAETEILKPHQIEELQGTDYPLTLLTCTLDGRTRVTVRCELVGEIPAI